MKSLQNHASDLRNILLMTATITPPDNVPFLARTDPQARLKDYQESLKFYLSLLNQGIDAIVFAENSNSDVSSLRSLAEQAGCSQQVEFLVFSGLDYPAGYGRAYGEFKLIDYAMEHSEFIKSSQDKQVIWKITGRYLVKNLAQIVARRPASDIYCNFRTIPKPWADMYLLAWTTKGYQNGLQGIYPKLQSNYDVAEVHPEEMFINLMGQFQDEVNLVKRINPVPQIEGVRGSDNEHYLQGRNLLKFRLRSIGQKLLPWIWI